MLPTASSLERANCCIGSALLPRVDEITGAATRGTAIHAFLARVAEVGRNDALAEVAEEYRPICAVIDLDVLPVSRLEVIAELALSFDPASGVVVELGRNLGRRYPPVGPRTFVGTADLVALSPSDVLVADYKSGHGVITPTAHNAQLRLLGLAAARRFGRQRARVAIVRIAEDGTPFFDSAELDAVELDVIADELRSLAGRIEGAKDLMDLGQPPPLTTGTHCRRCPCLVHCPTVTALARTLASQPEAVADEVMAALTPEQAATAWTRLALAQEVLRRAREGLYGYARDHDITLPNGLVVGEVEWKRRVLDGRTSFEVLRRLHGENVASTAASIEVTQASIERSLRGIAEATGEKLVKLKRQVMNALEQAGAVEVRVSRAVREHKPGPAGASLDEAA